MKKTPDAKNYILPKLYNRKGNLSLRWYIGFSAINLQTGELEEKRVYCPAKFETKRQREIWAKEHIGAITKHLLNGHTFGAEPEEEKQEEKPVPLIEALEKTILALSNSLRGKSIVTYTSALNKLKPFLARKGDNITLRQFSEQDALLFRDYLQSELHNSPRTANNTLIHLNTLYGHMSARFPAPKSPFKLRKLKQEITTKNIAFTNHDRTKLENYLQEQEPELYVVTRCIYYAFIRPGELHQLRVSDVRLEENYIVIPGNISKNGKTETVQIVPPLFRELSKIAQLDREQNAYLFGSGLAVSRYMSGKQVAFRRHEKALEACGLEGKGYTLYSWKHTGAVNAYRAGVGVKELQRLLRHSSLQITDIYLKSLGLRTDPNIQNYEW